MVQKGFVATPPKKSPHDKLDAGYPESKEDRLINEINVREDCRDEQWKEYRSKVQYTYTCIIAPRHRCSRSVSTSSGIQQKLNARKVKQENFYTRRLFTPVLPTLFSNTSIQHSSPTLLCNTVLRRFSTTLFFKHSSPTLLYNTLL